jgi:hypothetical protein
MGIAMSITDTMRLRMTHRDLMGLISPVAYRDAGLQAIL